MTTRRAVLIGIDDYEGTGQGLPARKDENGDGISFRNLRGCVNDVLAIQEFLIQTLEVDKHNIDTLLAPVPGTTSPYKQACKIVQKPTYENIVKVLEDVAQISAAGDMVYIHFSGHGACATTVFGALRQDKEHIDHCLVPSDIKQGGRYLRDLELGAMLQDIVDRNVILTVVLDSCFSGGAVRGNDLEEVEGIRGIRSISQSDQEVDLPGNMARVQHWANKATWLESPSGFVVLAACLDYQKAKEFSCRTEKETYIHGYLSYWLLDTIRNAPTRLSSRAIYDRVRSKVADNVASQTPYIIGDVNRFFFNQNVRSKVHTLTVLEVNRKPKRKGQHWLRLDGGRMDAVYVNSVYAILPFNFDPATTITKSDILAEVRVEGMMSRECRAVFLEPENIADLQWQKLDDGCLAVLQRLPLEGIARVRFNAVDGTQASQFKQDWQSLKGDKKLQLSNDDDAQFQIHLDQDDIYRISCVGDVFPAHISELLEPLTGNNCIPKLISRLEHIARFKLLKGLENPGIRLGNLPELISVTVEPSPNGRNIILDDYTNESIWIPAARSVQLQKDGVYCVQQKEWFRFNVTNNSEHTVGCVILDFNPELGISIMHPVLFHSIAPHETHQQDLFVNIPETLQDAAARDIAIVDTFKVFVSIPEKDLSAMELQKLQVTEDQEDWRGGEVPETLDDLLQELAPFCRDGNFVSKQPRLDSDWQTFDVRIRALT